MRIIGICPKCIDYINAKARFERSRVTRSICAGCDARGTFDTFKVGGSLGDPNCSDCMTMTHCESHHKVDGLYPFAETPR